MNFRGIDLNLLVLFEALLRERHVSRAAGRVGLSQPAMSHALNRLRHMLNDPILVRQGSHMVPTPTALRLSPRISELLANSLSIIANEQAFIPRDCRRTFRLGMTDYASASFLPRLLEEMQSQAPAAQLSVRHVGRAQGGRAVAEGEVDLALGNFLHHDDLKLYPLTTEKYLCAISRDHRFTGDRMTLEDYLSFPHLLVASSGEESGIVDIQLSLRGIRRDIACVVPHFLVAPMLLRNTNIVLTLMEGALRQSEEPCGLRLLEPPFDIPEYRSYMAWDPATEDDQALRWLRALIGQLFGNVPQETPTALCEVTIDRRP